MMRRAPIALAAIVIGSIGVGAQREARFVPEGGGPIDVGALDPAMASCESCHVDEAAHFAASLHARAASDPIFLAEYGPRPDPSCVRCHAPLAPEGASIDDASAQRGVGCPACHVREGRVLTSRAPSGRASHASVEEPALRTVDACVSCHQFRFSAPDASHPRFDPADAQQDTVAEWRNGPAHAQPCQHCHMRGSSAEAHTFPGAGDGALLASALRVRARARPTDDAIEVTLVLAARGVGHRFPTGDLFRRLHVEARTEAAEAHEDLRRFFAAQLAGERFVVGEVDDTRLSPRGARTMRLRVADASAAEVRWEISLWRLDPEVAVARGLGRELVRTLVAEGRIAVGR